MTIKVKNINIQHHSM